MLAAVFSPSSRPAARRMIARSQSPSIYGRAKLDLLQARVIAAASSAATVSSASRSNQIGGVIDEDQPPRINAALDEGQSPAQLPTFLKQVSCIGSSTA